MYCHNIVTVLYRSCFYLRYKSIQTVLFKFITLYCIGASIFKYILPDQFNLHCLPREVNYPDYIDLDQEEYKLIGKT